jgi:hypothetical protein
MDKPPPKSLTVSSDVLVQELQGEVMLLDLRSEHYYSLDDVGSRMWQALVEHGDVDSAVTALLEQYEVDEAELRRDLVELVERLAERGLLDVER